MSFLSRRRRRRRRRQWIRSLLNRYIYINVYVYRSAISVWSYVARAHAHSTCLVGGAFQFCIRKLFHDCNKRSGEYSSRLYSTTRCCSARFADISCSLPLSVFSYYSCLLLPFLTSFQISLDLRMTHNTSDRLERGLISTKTKNQNPKKKLTEIRIFWSKIKSFFCRQSSKILNKIDYCLCFGLVGMFSHMTSYCSEKARQFRARQTDSWQKRARFY